MRNRSIFFVIISGTLLLASANTRGQDRTEDAKALFNSGVKFHKAGAFIEAADAFRKANEIKPTWSLLFNIAQCETAAKRYGLAYEAFEDYVAMGGDEIREKRRETVMGELETLKKLIGTLKISAPEGATVTIDGVHRGTAPLPGRLKIGVGAVHTVQVHLDGELLLSDKVKVSQGERIRLAATSSPALDEVETAQTTDPSADEDSKPGAQHVVGWTGIGVGTSLLVAAAVTGGLTLSIKVELDDDCPGGICPEGKKDRKALKDKLMITCDVLWAAGAVVGSVGIGLLVAAHKKKKAGESQQAVSLTPALGPSSAGLTLSGRF